MGFLQTSSEQLFINLQEVLERTRELCLSYWITVLQSVYIIKHFFPYSFIFYKGHKWDKTIWRDNFIRMTKETGSAVWFRREGEGFCLHKQINRFSQTCAGRRSPPVRVTVCQPFFPLLRRTRMMNVGGMFWILSVDKCIQKSARHVLWPNQREEGRSA